MSFSIRDATHADLPKIVEIDSAAFAQPWSMLSFQAALDDPVRSIAIVIESEGVVCGFGVAWHVKDEGEIATLAVDESQRGKGLGEKIVRALVQELTTRGAAQIFLEVRPSNGGAQSLYKKIGFAQIGQRRNYYANGEDAIVMRKRNGRQ